MARMKTLWTQLSNKQRASAAIGVALGVIVLFGLFLYKTRESIKAEKIVEPRSDKTVLGIGNDGLLKDDVASKIQLLQEEATAKEKEQKETEKQLMAKLATQGEMLKQLMANVNTPATPDDLRAAPMVASLEGTPFPPAPQMNRRKATLVDEQGGPMHDELWVGGFGHASERPYEAASTTGKKKPMRVVTLSPGFMEAQLLTGMTMPAALSGKSEPRQIMLRVQAPAVLPNEVRAELTGCFVVANVYPEMSTERFETRTVSMHCNDPAGRAVINADIEGFVTDKDAMRGLTAVASSKQEDLLWPAFWTSVIGNVGQVFNEANRSVVVSPLGSTSVPDPEKAAQTALIGGVGETALEVRDIFLEYVRSMSPVLSMGPQKKATVVIVSPAKLEIQQRETGDLS